MFWHVWAFFAMSNLLVRYPLMLSILQFSLHRSALLWSRLPRILQIRNHLPPWFFYGDTVYHCNLDMLALDDLLVVASSLAVVRGRTKKTCITAIVNHFMQHRASLALLDSNSLPLRCMHVSLPNACCCDTQTSSPNICHWWMGCFCHPLGFVVPEWASRLPRLPITTRSRHDMVSALVRHVVNRVRYLLSVTFQCLCDILLSYFPFHLLTDPSHESFILQILSVEYGSDIISSLSNACTPAECATDVSQWPKVVPQDVVLSCLNQYYQGTIWSEPPVCAVCAQYCADMCHSVNVNGVHLLQPHAWWANTWPRRRSLWH